MNGSERKIGISEIVGTARLKTGEVQSAYRALRQLLCARCGNVIKTDDYFTRKPLSGISIPLSPRCRACVPFELTLVEEAEKKTSELLKSLLTPDEKETIKTRSDEETEEKFLSRLGPALEKTRRKK